MLIFVFFCFFFSPAPSSIFFLLGWLWRSEYPVLLAWVHSGGLLVVYVSLMTTASSQTSGISFAKLILCQVQVHFSVKVEGVYNDHCTFCLNNKVLQCTVCHLTSKWLCLNRHWSNRDFPLCLHVLLLILEVTASLHENQSLVEKPFVRNIEKRVITLLLSLSTSKYTCVFFSILSAVPLKPCSWELVPARNFCQDNGRIFDQGFSSSVSHQPC